MITCPVCGNEIDTFSGSCRYCGAGIGSEQVVNKGTGLRHKVINLERGRPFVEEALKRMECEISLARERKIRLLTLIHGYGSSGKGGKIRIACRRMLDYLVRKGDIKCVVAGERFNRKSGIGKDFIRRFPELESLCASDFNNPGITIVEL